jgi:hypothetical protein
MVRHRVADLHGRKPEVRQLLCSAIQSWADLMMSFRQRARHQQAPLCRHQIEYPGRRVRQFEPSGVLCDLVAGAWFQSSSPSLSMKRSLKPGSFIENASSRRTSLSDHDRRGDGCKPHGACPCFSSPLQSVQDLQLFVERRTGLESPLV